MARPNKQQTIIMFTTEEWPGIPNDHILRQLGHLDL